MAQCGFRRICTLIRGGERPRSPGALALVRGSDRKRGARVYRAVLGGLVLVGLVACGSPEAASPPDTAAAPEPTGGPAPEPPPPPQQAFLALLTPEQTAALRALQVPIVVPTAIPAGFAVSQVITEPAGADLGDPNYQLLYRGPDDRCFVVEYAAGGVGDIPATAYRVPVQPPLFPGEAYGLNYGPYADPDLRSQFPEPELASDWLIGEQGAYRLAGAAYINDTLAPTPPCQDIDPDTAVTLIESLTLLTNTIEGDG